MAAGAFGRRRPFRLFLPFYVFGDLAERALRHASLRRFVRDRVRRQLSVGVAIEYGRVGEAFLAGFGEVQAPAASPTSAFGYDQLASLHQREVAHRRARVDDEQIMVSDAPLTHELNTRKAADSVGTRVCTVDRETNLATIGS